MPRSRRLFASFLNQGRALYRECGFTETRREKDSKHGGHTLYLELKLA